MRKGWRRYECYWENRCEHYVYKDGHFTVFRKKGAKRWKSNIYKVKTFLTKLEAMKDVEFVSSYAKRGE